MDLLLQYGPINCNSGICDSPHLVFKRHAYVALAIHQPYSSILPLCLFCLDFARGHGSGKRVHNSPVLCLSPHSLTHRLNNIASINILTWVRAELCISQQQPGQRSLCSSFTRSPCSFSDGGWYTYITDMTGDSWHTWSHTFQVTNP